MLYTIERLDRTSGQLRKTEEAWLTVTEVGEVHDVGNRRIRAILHHMGLLQQEGQRYRLAPFAVESGLGLRHDNPKSDRPFDVISPVGQARIAEAWDYTVADYEAELSALTGAAEATKALAAFKEGRWGEMTTQEEVCWLADHFPRMTHDTMAEILGVTQPLVSRYAKQQTKDRAALAADRQRSFSEV